MGRGAQRLYCIFCASPTRFNSQTNVVTVMPTTSVVYSTMAHDSAWESEWDNAMNSLERGEYERLDEESAYELLGTIRSGRGNL